MDDELWSRSVASICGALTVLSEANDPKKKAPENPLELGLAYSDVWLENIMRGCVQVDVATGKVTFDRDGRPPRRKRKPVPRTD